MGVRQLLLLILLITLLGEITSGVPALWRRSVTAPTPSFTFQGNNNEKYNYGVMNGWGYINVLNAPYNATGNGVTDDGPSIQAALNDAGTTGGIVFLPPGNYLIEENLLVPAGVTLKGTAESAYSLWGSGTTVAGTTLLAVNQNVPLISLVGTDAGVKGLQIFYPEQTPTNPPITYAAAIQGGCATCQRVDNVFVEDVLLVNPFIGIDVATYTVGRHFIARVYGQPLQMGIMVDKCYDIGRIEHVHFVPFWNGDQEILDYINNNGFSFHFARSDWEVVHDVFSWGYHTGMTFASSAAGALNGQFSDINFDNVDVGLDIYITQDPGLQITNLNLANAGGGKYRIGVWGHAGNETRVMINSMSVWGEFNVPVLWQGPGYLSVINSNFVAWNAANPAIDIQTGRATISTCYFSDTIGVGINIGPDTDRVIVMGNQMVGNGLVISNPNAINSANDL